MQVTEAAKTLAAAIQDSPEYREFRQYKEELDGDAGVKALVDEYKRLQTVIQMKMLAGQAGDDSETQRFQSLGMLLFADPRTSGYLMAEMRLQRMMAEVFQTLTQAAGMDIPLPV